MSPNFSSIWYSTSLLRPWNSHWYMVLYHIAPVVSRFASWKTISTMIISAQNYYLQAGKPSAPSSSVLKTTKQWIISQIIRYIPPKKWNHIIIICAKTSNRFPCAFHSAGLKSVWSFAGKLPRLRSWPWGQAGDPTWEFLYQHGAEEKCKRSMQF